MPSSQKVQAALAVDRVLIQWRFLIVWTLMNMMFLVPEHTKRQRKPRVPKPQFKELKKNIWIGKETPKNKTPKSDICACAGEGWKCADRGCSNRQVFVECGPKCPVEDCENQRLQQRKYADTEYFVAGAKGFGLRAKSPIKIGELISEYIGDIIDRKMYKKLQKVYDNEGIPHHYFMNNGRVIIDATKRGSFARCINHSCDPNAEINKWRVPGTKGDIYRIGIYAKKRIAAGDEITINYQFDTRGRQRQQCFCGAANCSGFIGRVPREIPQNLQPEIEERPLTSRGRKRPASDALLPKKTVKKPRQKRMPLGNKKNSENVVPVAQTKDEEGQGPSEGAVVAKKRRGRPPKRQ